MEGEGLVEGASSPAESPTAPSPSGDPTPSQATTPPAQQPGQPADPNQTVPFHQHPRWQQVIRENQQLKQGYAGLQQKVQQLETLQQKAQQQGGLSQDDRKAYSEAYAALEQVLAASPKGQALLRMAEQAESIQGLQQGVQQMQQAQRQALARQGVSHIHDLAKKAELPADPNYLARLVNLVEAEALQIPDGRQRFAQGDLSVLDEAFQAVKEQFLTHMQRASTAGLLDTKRKTQGLPPVGRGAAAGPPGLSKFDPTKPNAVRERLAELGRVAQAQLAEGRQE